MPRIDNPTGIATVDVLAAMPKRVDLVASSTALSEPGWSFSAPTSTSLSIVTDYDTSPSIQMSDSATTARPSIASAVGDDLWNDLWNYGGRLYYRFAGPTAVAGECCTVGFGAPVSPARGWVPSAPSTTGYIGGAVTIKRTTTGFDFYWFNSDVKIGTVTSGTTASVDLELRATASSSRLDLYANGTLIATLSTWLPVDEFFTGIVGVYTRPSTVTTQPVNIRRLMIMAFGDNGIITIPTAQAATRVVLPDDGRAWTIKVPDDFPRNATIDVVNRGCNSVTFAPVNKALFNGRFNALHSRVSGMILRVTALQVGGDPGNWWVTGT